MHRQAIWDEPLITDRQCDESVESPLPERIARKKAPRIPCREEFEAVRHYTRLSQMNFGVDSGTYPLGSCTMKYNPAYCEDLAGRASAVSLHPLAPSRHSQGSLGIMFHLQRALCELGGVDEVTLEPSAGAQGEFTGMMVVRAYHLDRGDAARNEVIVPESAHGTNPASAAMAGFKVVQIPSRDGLVDPEALKAALSPRTAAMMLTNPNTLGLFEKDVQEIERLVHGAGALLYYDGANLNAIMGKTKPGRMGFDIVHFNLHKTFATPHGGGGPGCGPIGVKAFLRDFLPVPVVAKGSTGYFLDHSLPKSIGRVMGTQGNFLVMLRAYAYIAALGSDGLTQASERAVLNANYVMNGVRGALDVPYDGWRKHEFVASAERLANEKGIHATDIAKYMLDEGIHAPTIYFPLLIHEAVMVEPTETATKEELDALISVLRRAASEATGQHPMNMSRERVDDVGAARNPVLSELMERMKKG